jgi:hypothetical protein
MRTHLWLAAGLLGLAALCGCGDSGSSDPGVVEEAPSEEGIKRRSASNLPKAGDFLPVLDDGKVELAPPDGWNLLSRDARYLARFAKGKQHELPRISIMAGDSPESSITELTPDNYEKLAQVLMTQMQGEKKRIEEPCRPIYLGDRLYLRHVRIAKLSSDNVVLQSLQTVHGGRLYTIELVCEIDAPRAEEYEASLKKHRDEGYTVGANLRFVGDAPATESPAEATPFTPPASPDGEKPAKP